MRLHSLNSLLNFIPFYAILLLLKCSISEAFLPPAAHLTNSIYSPNEEIFSAENPTDVEAETDDADDTPSAYRNKLTFRRRNVNSNAFGGGGNSAPFSRMSYKGGYGGRMGGGSNRGNRGGMMTRQRKNYPMQSPMSNPFSLYNSYSGEPSSYYQPSRGNSFASGLLGQKPMSIYGSSRYGRFNKMSSSRPFDHYGGDIYSSYPHSFYNRLSSTFTSPPSSSRYDYSPYDNPGWYNRGMGSSNDIDPYSQIATNQWHISRPNTIAAATAKDSAMELDSYDSYKEKTNKN